MKIRVYEEWQDENMNSDCCVCNDEPGIFVIDFGNYKTTLCEKCIDRFIDELQKCKKVKICGHCKYRNEPEFGFKCTCEKTNMFNYHVAYTDYACKHFEREGDGV